MRLFSVRTRYALLTIASLAGCTSAAHEGTPGPMPDGGAGTMDAGMADARPPSDSGLDADAARHDSGSPEAGTDAGAPDLLPGSLYGFSTVPPTGPADVNPYGLAFVPAGFPTNGTLQPGDLLLSNFNDPTNAQGTGTTIVRITPAGARSTFFISPLQGLSAGLAVLSSGLIITGNVPSGGAGIGAGALQVLDGNGNVLQTITDAALLQDPWDLTVDENGSQVRIFVSNVVSGNVTRLDCTVSGSTLTVNAKVQIASGYATRPDANAFVVGPGGLVYDRGSDTLYVASADEKVGGVEAGSIFAVAQAGSRMTDAAMGAPIFADAAHLHGPIGMTRAPNGDLLFANSDAVNADPNHPSSIVQITTAGQLVRDISIDPANGGAFGIASGSFGGQPVFAALDDNQSTLTVWATGQPYAAVTQVSSVPPSGSADLNPYGVTVVPPQFPTTGMLQPGDVLWSNFNDANNGAGLGTTIVRMTAAGARSTFFTSALPGLSAGLVALQAGLVVTGNVPSSGQGIGQGALQVLDGDGNVVKTLTDAKLLADPWDIAVHDMGSTAQLFVSNVVSGTITRVDVAIAGSTLTVNGMTQIASGYATRPDANAFVVGPGGMVYDATTDVLYVASAAEKLQGVEVGALFALAKAGTTTSDQGKGTLVYSDAAHLHGPIGLVRAPNGDLVVANSDAVNADPMHPSALVEVTTGGAFVREQSIDPANGGAFGLTIAGDGAQRVMAVLDDNQALLSLRALP